MKRWWQMVMTVTAASLWVGCAAFGAEEASKAGGKEPNVSPEKGKEGSAAAVSLLHQAGALVRYARENESPEAMLTAVQMIRRVRFQDGASRVGSKKSEAQDKGEQKKEGKKASTAPPSLDAVKLLAEAKVWAKGNEHLAALITAEEAREKPASSGTLGAVVGPVVHIDQVFSRQIDRYVIDFRGREVARVAVVGDGDTDLDLYVYDENGSEIGKDIGLTDRCVVEWTPRRTGKFEVRIVNNGYLYNNYALATN